MFLNAVVLVLQEILEAALLISVLVTFTLILNKQFKDKFQVKRVWILHALWIGTVGAWIYAMNMTAVSEWFDYVGQEVANGSIHVLILCFVIAFIFLVPKVNNEYVMLIKKNRIISFCMISIVVLAITREGSEIILYMTGVASLPQNTTAVLFGGFIGAGIGISTGVLLFYLLINLKQQLSFKISMGLLALVAGNMASQAVLSFTQADWLPFTPILWDSTEFLPEDKVLGQLLYALIGYEATPSVLQVGCYVLAAGFVLSCPLNRLAWKIKK